MEEQVMNQGEQVVQPGGGYPSQQSGYPSQQGYSSQPDWRAGLAPELQSSMQKFNDPESLARAYTGLQDIALELRVTEACC
jgi:hypothetical protein